MVTVEPAGSSGATATSGTKWNPALVAREMAGRATVTIASVMTDARRRGLMVLEGERNVLDKIQSSSRTVCYYSNKVSGYVCVLNLG